MNPVPFCRHTYWRARVKLLVIIGERRDYSFFSMLFYIVEGLYIEYRSRSIIRKAHYNLENTYY